MKKIIIPAIVLLICIHMNLNANATAEYSRLAKVYAVETMADGQKEIVIETTDGYLWGYITDDSKGLYAGYKGMVVFDDNGTETKFDDIVVNFY